MKKFFLPVMMLGFFAFTNVQAQTPVTVKKAPAPVQVTKAPPITVTKAPATATKAPPINVAPSTKTTTTTKTSTTKTSTTKTTTVAAPAKAAPVQKTTTVKKTTVVKKTTTVATKHKAPAKKAVAKKAPVAPLAPPPPPPPPVQEEVILPRPTEQPVVNTEVRERKVSSGDQMNGRNDDEGNEGHKKGCCPQGHQDCCDKYGDQPWRFRHRHHSTYEYINSFYDRNCESGCKKHCGHDKKDRDNDD